MCGPPLYGGTRGLPSRPPPQPLHAIESQGQRAGTVHIATEGQTVAEPNPGSDWVRAALRASRARNIHLSEPHHDKILAVAHHHGWTYDEALNYVVGIGLGVIHTVEGAKITRSPAGHILKFHTRAETSRTGPMPLVRADCTCGYTTGLTTARDATRGAQTHIDTIADGRTP